MGLTSPYKLQVTTRLSICKMMQQGATSMSQLGNTVVSPTTTIVLQDLTQVRRKLLSHHREHPEPLLAIPLPMTPSLLTLAHTLPREPHQLEDCVASNPSLSCFYKASSFRYNLETMTTQEP